MDITVGIFYKEQIEELQEELDEYKSILEENIKSASDSKIKIDDAYNFIEGKKGEIARLTGMAADGSLGSKFNSRGEEISRTIYWWRISLIITIIMSAIWIIFVFTNLDAHLPNEWANLYVNFAKTSPAFILIGFVFSQYKKERNLQEEYTFKSSVAMTLTAYSEMLESSDRDDNISRQQMLIKSIEMIYSQPRLYSDKTENNNTNNIKEIKETISNLLDTVKSLKS